MAPWQIGRVYWQREEFSPAVGYTADDLEVTLGLEHTFRGGFTVINGTGPINAGDLQPERYVADAWQSWGALGRNVNPGYTVFPVDYPPEWVEWPFRFVTGSYYYEGALVPTRLRVEWDGGPYYSDVILPAQDTLDVTFVEAVVPAGAGELDEWFDGETIVVEGVGQIPGKLELPYGVSLKVSGTRPSVLVESARVPDVAHGDGVVDPDTADEYTVAGIRTSGASGLTQLVLEEGA